MQKITANDWIITFLYISLLVLIIVIGAIFLLPRLWYIWTAIVILGVLTLVKWHTDNFAYKCKNCKHEFAISIWLNLISPHGINRNGAWQLLKCPKCHKWSKAEIIKRNK
jgi:hypothetical protein